MYSSYSAAPQTQATESFFLCQCVSLIIAQMFECVSTLCKIKFHRPLSITHNWTAVTKNVRAWDFAERTTLKTNPIHTLATV